MSGAYLLIGLKYGQCQKDDAAAKEKTYELVREFERRFAERNKTTVCRELLGVDLQTGDQALARERVGRVCPKMVSDAAEIVEEILEDEINT